MMKSAARKFQGAAAVGTCHQDFGVDSDWWLLGKGDVVLTRAIRLFCLVPLVGVLVHCFEEPHDESLAGGTSSVAASPGTGGQGTGGQGGGSSVDSAAGAGGDWGAAGSGSAGNGGNDAGAAGSGEQPEPCAVPLEGAACPDGYWAMSGYTVDFDNGCLQTPFVDLYCVHSATTGFICIAAKASSSYYLAGDAQCFPNSDWDYCPPEQAEQVGLLVECP